MSVANSYVPSLEKPFKVPDVKDSARNFLKNTTTADTDIKYDSSRMHDSSRLRNSQLHNSTEQKGMLNFP